MDLGCKGLLEVGEGPERGTAVTGARGQTDGDRLMLTHPPGSHAVDGIGRNRALDPG